jgi:hypothetical protein
MYLLIVTLVEDSMHNLVSILAELGIQHSWINQCETLRRHLVYDIHLFAGFRDSYDDSDSAYQTLYALIDELEIAKKVKSMLNSVDIHLQDPSIGTMVVVPISIAIGEDLEFIDEEI